MNAAVSLFWEAFRGKLGSVMRPDDKALRFLGHVADPDHVLSAVGPGGQLLGIAGFKTELGAFIGGELSDLQVVYGRWGGLWRGLTLSVLERPLAPGDLLMDGIVVDAAARGQGVGTGLLTAVTEVARERGDSLVRLDVIDSNPRARALYERFGFEARDKTDLGPLRYVFGIRSVTEMVYTV